MMHSYFIPVVYMIYSLWKYLFYRTKQHITFVDLHVKVYIWLDPTTWVLTPWVRSDGYSRSLRDATGPVDVYSRIPTSMQLTCIATSYIRVHVHMHYA